MIPRTHVVDLYRRLDERGGRGEEAVGFEASPYMTAVECNLYPMDVGRVVEAFGEDQRVAVEGYFPSSQVVEQGSGVKIRQNLQGGAQDLPENLQVEGVAPWGESFDTQVWLIPTREALG